MGKKLYVGNLPYSVDQVELQDRIGKYCTVKSANLVTNRDTGLRKGFGCVEMFSSAEVQKAIQEINGTSFDGRTLTVNEAKPQEKRSGGGGGRW